MIEVQLLPVAISADVEAAEAQTAVVADQQDEEDREAIRKPGSIELTLANSADPQMRRRWRAARGAGVRALTIAFRRTNACTATSDDLGSCITAIRRFILVNGINRYRLYSIIV